MDFPHALPLPPSAMSLQGLDTHIATGLGAMQEQSQTTLREFAPGSVAGRHKAAAPIHVREWPARNESPQLSAQFSPQSWAPAQVATCQHVITLQLQDSGTRDRLDEYLCSFWDTRKLFFMHPHDMAAHGLSEGDSVLVSAAAPGVQMRQMVRLRVVPYDLPRGTARGYFRECAALVTSESASADGGIGVHVVSMAH